jgi:hypothetical protein
MNVRALLTAGDRLRESQAELMRGGSADGLRRAQESEGRALVALLDAGRGVVNGEATLRRLEATLRAAAVDSEARGLLERGRLTKDLTPPGFDFSGMPTPPKRRRSRSRAAKPAPAAERKRELAEARAALQEAERWARAAEREAEKARKEVTKAEEQVRNLERSNR